MTLSPPMAAARQRLADVIMKGRELLKHQVDGFISDQEGRAAWETSSLQIIRNLTGKGSHYEETFTDGLYAAVSYIESHIGTLRGLLEDLDAGQLHDLPALVRAEVFADLLEQAEYLLSEGFHVAAAVLAGGVLEDCLRKLCDKHAITLQAKPKMDGMNAELAKKNVYNLLVQKQVTAWADLRNKAAHGRTTEFDKRDVEHMLPPVRDFIAKHT